MKKSVEERFWEKVEKTDYCWNWTATKSKRGYGTFRIDDKMIRVHRFSYELHKGKILNGLTIDHLCRNRSCVNPDHLEAVTIKKNTLRGIGPASQNVKKTHCPKGHKYSGSNLYVLNGTRYCKTCKLDNQRKQRNTSLNS